MPLSEIKVTYGEQPSRPLGCYNGAADFVATLILTVGSLVVLTSFALYGQTLEEQIKNLQYARVQVEAELKQLELARPAIEKYRTQLQTLTEKLALAKLAKKKKKSHK